MGGQNVLPRQFLSIVESAAFYEELQQRDGLLRAIRVHDRHVDVIDEEDELFASGGAIRSLEALFNVALDVHLQVFAACS